ncbi:MAG: hypothetical protein Q4B04_05095 [bacterium]|nr:hypothetical protein [bacterium]
MNRIEFRNNFLKAIIHNKSLIAMFLLFIISFVCGSGLAKNADSFTNEFIKGIVTNFVSVRTDSSFLIVLFNSFFSCAGFLLLFYVIGLCAVGPVLSPLVLAFKGIGCGMLVGFLYATYELKGIAFTAIIILPPMLLFTIIYIFASREAFKFSVIFFKTLLPNIKQTGLNSSFRMYCARFVFMVFICIIGALLDAILTSAFIRFFSF